MIYGIIMDVILLNSKTAIARIPRSGFSGEITEVEKVAEEAGVYGNVTSYSIDYNEGSAYVTFTLADSM